MLKWESAWRGQPGTHCMGRRPVPPPPPPPGRARQHSEEGTAQATSRSLPAAAPTHPEPSRWRGGSPSPAAGRPRPAPGRGREGGRWGMVGGERRRQRGIRQLGGAHLTHLTQALHLAPATPPARPTHQRADALELGRQPAVLQVVDEAAGGGHQHVAAPRQPVALAAGQAGGAGGRGEGGEQETRGGHPHVAAPRFTRPSSSPGLQHLLMLVPP